MTHARPLDPTSPDSVVLLACRDLALRLLSESLDAYFTELEERFFALADATHDRELRDVYMAARMEVQQKKHEIASAFRQGFVDAFNQRWQGETNSGFFRVQVNPGELSLVANDDYEENMSAERAASTLKQSGGDTLSQLEARLASLLPRSEETLNGSPLSPDAICEAFLSACRELECGLNARLVAMQAFEQSISGQMAQIYDQVNQYLVQQHVEPIAPGRPRSMASRAARQDVRPESQPEAAPSPQFGLAAGMSMGGMPGGMPAAAQMEWAAASMRGAQLAHHFDQLISGRSLAGGASPRPDWFSFLSNLQNDLPNVDHGDGAPENLLSLLGRTRWARSLGQSDMMTVDLVSMLFDRLFDDANLPAAAKQLLARLQVPILKVALLDGTFFAEKQHSARRVLDHFESLFFDHNNTPDDPLLGELSNVIGWLVDHFDEDMSVFDEAVSRIEALSHQAEDRSAVSLAASTVELVEHEVAELSGVTVNALIDRQLAEAGEIPQPVHGFVTGIWQRVLLDSFGPEGEEGAVFAKYRTALEHLLWSVRPKSSPEQRLELVNVLPGLLKALDEGMRRVSVPDAVSKPFFTELVQCHAAAIRNGVRDAVKIRVAPPAGEEVPVLTDEAVVEEVGVVYVAPVVPLPKVPDEPVLARGAMVIWRADPLGEAVRLRLSWISPQKTRYVFTSRVGGDALTLTVPELQRALRDGALVVYSDDASATERALSQLRAGLEAA
ncbi:DUF1631 family protein [Chitinibacteraceae bacterium HSL-7]